MALVQERDEARAELTASRSAVCAAFNGEGARMDGEHQSANPHAEDSDEWICWDDGWQRQDTVERLEAAQAQVAALRDALDSALPEVDSCHWPAVQAVCEQVGYGVVMTTAAALWRGIQPGGEFYVGPCQATVDAAIRDTEAAAREWRAEVEAGALERAALTMQLPYGGGQGYLDACSWLRARAANIRAKAREGRE